MLKSTSLQWNDFKWIEPFSCTDWVVGSWREAKLDSKGLFVPDAKVDGAVFAEDNRLRFLNLEWIENSELVIYTWFLSRNYLNSIVRHGLPWFGIRGSNSYDQAKNKRWFQWSHTRLLFWTNEQKKWWEASNQRALYTFSRERSFSREQNSRLERDLREKIWVIPGW